MSASYSISKLDGLSPEAVKTLKAAGIRTTRRFLEAAKDAKGRKQIAVQLGMDEKCVLRLANMADRMRVKGLGTEYAELLRAAGVDTVKELKYRNPAKLAQALAAANAKRKLVRLLPTENTVGRWIEDAKTLPLKIKY